MSDQPKRTTPYDDESSANILASVRGWIKPLQTHPHDEDALEREPMRRPWLTRLTLTASRFRISTQMYIGIGGVVLLAIAASLVGWFSFTRVGTVQSQVNEGRVPEVVAAFGAAQFSRALVAAAPRLTAAVTLEDFEQVSANIDQSYAAFEEQLAVLGRSGSGDERFERIRALADKLIQNIEAVKDEKSRLFELADRRVVLGAELADLRFRLDDVLLPAIDDQLFYTLTGYRDIDEQPSPRSVHFSESELERYRYLAELQADANIATQLLASAFSLSSASSIEPLVERFEAAESRIERSLSGLEESTLRSELTVIFAQLFELGGGEQSGFNLLASELRLATHQERLLTQNEDIEVEMVAEMDTLVGASQAGVQEATLASDQAILAGRTFLLAISGVTIGGAVLAWFFVGQVLTRRLERLSNWMRRMAGGDLEATARIEGRDEVADMAAALEVFRRHAVEVQRLNLVEKLATDLQDKNDQLEVVLGDLRRAQDQIVTREKLAALGQLTAGVAHEIRNPLNFVKNFSEVSEELLVELQETLDEGGKELNEDQHSLIQEISEDLTGNLERIRSHGDRANRIVHDMLMMGRDTGSWQVTNINNLLDEHARLAYHSARATDPNFQLELKQNLDPNVGEINVIPRDLGRVFLNIVGNACDATDDKRRAITDGEPYTPTIWLATQLGEEGVDIRIRDNGNGIPPEVADKIFNPFFTTKPTDRGTGLGLAISSDIVRQHGGAIMVNSEPGQYTEMVIELPLEPSQESLAEPEEEGDEMADEPSEALRS